MEHCDNSNSSSAQEAASTGPTRTVWYSEGLEDTNITRTSSWCPLQGEHTVTLSPKTGAYSVYVRRHPGGGGSHLGGDDDDLGDEDQEESFMSKVWSSVRSGVSRWLPSVYYSVQAEALLQAAPGDGLSVGLVVLVRHAATRGRCGHYRKHLAPSRMTSLPAGTVVVGRTLTPRMVKSGQLQVRIISKDLEADTEQGEDASLCKTEQDFCGRDFEKQFACRYKLGPVKEGIFGKVVVEHVRETGEVQQVLEFNLTRGGETTPGAAASQQQVQQPAPSPATTKGMSASEVARRPIHELATSLRLREGHNWRTLAGHLGFSNKEVCRFASDPEPLSRVFSSYQSRGGTADEIVQALYDVSRQLSPSPVKRTRSTSSDDFLPRLPVRSQSSVSSQTTLLLGESEDEAEDDVTGSLSRSDTLELSPKGIFPLTSSPFTLTPPTTPRKRNSPSGSSDTDFSSLTRSPTKRMRVCTSLFSFDNPEEELARRMCVEAVDDAALWRLSQHLQREWKHVGRTLQVPEPELYNIEHAHRDLRECAYQTLLRWKDMYPRKYTYGTLYSALCDNGLTAHAQAYCTVKNTVPTTDM